MLTIMGATGHTGRVAANTLLKAGQGVRVIGRRSAPLKEMATRGAEAAVGDAGDAAFLTRAFRGSDAVYTLIPPDPGSPDFSLQQDRMGEAMVRAIRDSGVRYVVFLSSVGAQHRSGTGPIAGLHRHELRLAELKDVNVLILRAGYFFENHLGSLPLIQQQGINGSPIRGDIAFPMVATHDVGHVAAHALRTRDFGGLNVRELLGPRDYSMDEVTRMIGPAIGKPELAYVQFPYEAALDAMVAAGLSPSVASLYVEMGRAINDGLVRSVQGRNVRTTTPTRMEDFVTHTLAPAYRATQ